MNNSDYAKLMQARSAARERYHETLSAEACQEYKQLDDQVQQEKCRRYHEQQETETAS